MNYFSVMVRRRMRNDDDVEEEPLPGISSGKKGGKKGMSLSCLESRRIFLFNALPHGRCYPLITGIC